MIKLSAGGCSVLAEQRQKAIVAPKTLDKRGRETIVSIWINALQPVPACTVQLPKISGYSLPL
jgi:hypothetical protein